MTNIPAYQPRRPRMDQESYRRILAEVEHLGRPDPKEITEATSQLRDVLLDPIEDIPEAPPETPTQAAQTPAPAEPMEPSLANAWNSLGLLEVKSRTLDKNLVITANRTDPAYASFDVLRTRLVQALREKGWRRVAITSPSTGCGKSFTAVNLAMTLSRYEDCRTILLDMDLRRPALKRYLGTSNTGNLGDVLRGDVSFADHLKLIEASNINIGKNLAIGLNEKPEPYAAELFQTPKTRSVLEQMMSDYEPDVVLYDLPPALAQDDVIAFRSYFDCVLMVVGGGISTAQEVKEVNRRIGEDKPVLGVVLNMAEGTEGGAYAY